ncbi:GntR family transcriptional regulator [Pelagibacterium xiamenense]|uniref:GntR family transcriptional regulator n=1 Tax=Pelagibacterium xiamenense TaxID=2901140 RepID=UPI001E5B4D73|nr:GntR family transcriptional regulator [Pelagibacterium xiamenense]MCD7058976.1 GntR family transcriptional regulator [Pelagibacterium xiamenense]
MTQWRDDTPIFIQIRQQMIGMILGGTIGEGDPLPSVRQVATDLSVNPLTVTKAYQSLVDLEIVEKRRGLGMFVLAGAREKLRTYERQKFLEEDWPVIKERIASLGLSLDDLLKREGKGDE